LNLIGFDEESWIRREEAAIQKWLIGTVNDSPSSTREFI
jgi:hypothetical protein